MTDGKISNAFNWVLLVFIHFLLLFCFVSLMLIFEHTPLLPVSHWKGFAAVFVTRWSFSLSWTYSTSSFCFLAQYGLFNELLVQPETSFNLHHGCTVESLDPTGPTGPTRRLDNLFSCRHSYGSSRQLPAREVTTNIAISGSARVQMNDKRANGVWQRRGESPRPEPSDTVAFCLP